MVALSAFPLSLFFDFSSVPLDRIYDQWIHWHWLLFVFWYHFRLGQTSAANDDVASSHFLRVLASPGQVCCLFWWFGNTRQQTNQTKAKDLCHPLSLSLSCILAFPGIGLTEGTI